mmetsp:Transcript_182/g.466  ORF Transcript_182/g.466 Transcript_182/m.466 type:complete len:208 (-) Transcript_182:679-1302(-)
MVGWWRQSCARLVDADGAVDLSDKGEGGKEADKAGHEEERDRHERHVARVDADGRDVDAFEARLRHEVVQRVQKNVQARRAGCEERLPPPLVVLVAEQQIREHNAHLGAGQHEDQKHEQQKPKHVVHLVLPDRVEDEHELHKHHAERKHAGDEQVARLWHAERRRRNLPRDLVGAHRKFRRLLFVAEVRAEEHQRNADAEPHDEQQQ